VIGAAQRHHRHDGEPDAQLDFLEHDQLLLLSLGDKRKVTAECEAHLQALEAALAKHEFTATR
jgi:hypothetical protein